MFLLASDPSVVFTPVPVPAPIPVVPPYTPPPRSFPLPGQIVPDPQLPGPAKLFVRTITTYAPTAPSDPVNQQAAPSSSKPATSMAYSPNAPLPINSPPDAVAATQLPTVTVWASRFSGQWQLIAAIVLAVIIIAAYRHSRH